MTADHAQQATCPARLRAVLCGLAGCIVLAMPAAGEPLLITVPEPVAFPAADAPDPTPAESAGCEPAIAAAAAAHAVPADLLLAIGMVESGLTPWVLNAEGTPYFFDDPTSAVAALERLQAEGINSIDVGCMQVNLRWHPEAFADSATALDPVANADYSAKFLLGLFAMTGSWTDAVAYYHSSAQRYQRPYVCAVSARLEELGSDMDLNCLPSDEIDLPQVAASSPARIATPTVETGPQHMLRIAPASGSTPTVVRGQSSPPAAADTDSTTGPRVIRVR